MLGKSSKNIIPNGGAFNADESHGAIRKKNHQTNESKNWILARKKNILMSTKIWMPKMEANRVAQGVFESKILRPPKKKIQFPCLPNTSPLKKRYISQSKMTKDHQIISHQNEESRDSRKCFSLWNLWDGFF